MKRSIACLSLALACTVSCGSTPAANTGTQAGSTAPTEDRPRRLVKASASPSLANALSRAIEASQPIAEDQIGKKPVPFRAGANDDATIPVLFAYDDADAGRGIDACELLSGPDLRGIDVCESETACTAASDEAASLVLCRARVLRALEVALIASHDAKANNAIVSSDWNYMTFATALEADADKVTRGLSVDLPEEHIAGHLTFAALFALNRALYFAKEKPAAEREVYQGTGKSTGAPSEACWQHRALRRNGLGPELPFPLDPLPSPEQKALADKLDRTWQAELEADGYGAIIVAAAAQAAIENGADTRTVLLDYVVNTFQVWSYYDWYRRLGRFAITHCGHVAKATFPITRCTCRDRSLYHKLSDLFEPAAPPRYVRLLRAIHVMFSDEDMTAKLDKALKDDIAVRMLVLQNFMEVPAKLSMGACMLDIAPDEGAHIAFPDMPAMEGLTGDDINQEFVGAPVESVMTELASYCAADK